MAEAQSVRFEAHLQRGGTGVPEMIRLLQAYDAHHSLDELKRQVFKDNLLGKTSTDLVKDVFYAFRKRFFIANDLPPIEYLSLIECKPISDAIRGQILIPYFLAADPMAMHFYRHLILSRANSASPTITSEEVYSNFEAAGVEHPEIMMWSQQVRTRWSRGFVRMMRQFNLVEPHPSTRIKRLWLMPETFSYYFLWFWQSGGSFRSADHSDWWELLQVEGITKADLLSEGQLRGWWQIRQAGEIVQFQPKYEKLEDWIHHGLD